MYISVRNNCCKIPMVGVFSEKLWRLCPALIEHNATYESVPWINHTEIDSIQGHSTGS